MSTINLLEISNLILVTNNLQVANNLQMSNRLLAPGSGSGPIIPSGFELEDSSGVILLESGDILLTEVQ